MSRVLDTFYSVKNNREITSYSLSEIAEHCQLITSFDLANQESTTRWIPRGNGNSYSPSAQISKGFAVRHLGKEMTWLNPLKTTLKVESGADVRSVYEFCLKSDRSLKVVPGTGKVTIGGAIAFDVHGKNHKSNGTFGSHVLEIEIQLASGDHIICNRIKNVDLFRATIGGMGLTGIILNAIIEVEPVSIRNFDMYNCHFDNYEKLLDALAEESTYSHQIAWLNLTRSSKFQAILTKAKPSPAEYVNNKIKIPLVKYKFPINFFTKPNIFIITNLRMFIQRVTSNKHRISNYSTILFPLDKIPIWNYMFGKKGLIEFQFYFPRNSSDQALDLIKRINSESPGVLIALKYFGRNTSIGLMSFPAEGYCMGITTHSARLTKQSLRKYTTMVTELGGRVYLAKNCLLNLKELSAQYSRLEEFLKVKERFDIKQQLASDLSNIIFSLDTEDK